MNKRGITAMWAAAAATLAVGAVHAQQPPYPAKVIRIVTAAPGSNNDRGARIVGDVELDINRISKMLEATGFPTKR